MTRVRALAVVEFEGTPDQVDVLFDMLRISAASVAGARVRRANTNDIERFLPKLGVPDDPNRPNLIGPLEVET